MEYIYAKRLKDPEKAARHRRLAGDAARRMRRLKKAGGSADPAMLRRPLTSDQTPTAPSAPLPESESPPDPPDRCPPLSRAVVVVSGLPRAGTSMVMQMLQAGGLPVLADEDRQADEDNPRGYFEYEPVKRLRQDNAWLDQARGKAVKVIAPLLDSLKPGVAYGVLMVERDLDEILQSQERMLARQARSGSELSGSRLKAIYRKQLRQIKRMLSENHVATLFLDHRLCVTDPAAASDRINAFFGGCLDASAMARAVDPTLYRQRRPA
jgi:hypothetical protein